LNHPEAVALICDETMERAREGATLAAAREHGMSALRQEEVMEGVPELARVIEVEAIFEDGPKLVTLRNPIR
jgi:urease gamma subunit